MMTKRQKSSPSLLKEEEPISIFQIKPYDQKGIEPLYEDLKARLNNIARIQAMLTAEEGALVGLKSVMLRHITILKDKYKLPDGDWDIDCEKMILTREPDPPKQQPRNKNGRKK